MSNKRNKVRQFLCGHRILRDVRQALLILLLAVFAVPITALAENEEERAAIYVQVPEDWENPCIWAWDEAGNNAFAAWPGGKLDTDTNNAGWYYTWIPAWADHVIINAKEGSVQTDELVLDGKNTWVTVEDAEKVQITTEKQTKGDIPEYVEKFTVHVKTDKSWENPCLWAWSAPDGKNVFDAWPGEALTRAENGWYEAEVPVWINSLIVNAKDGEIQTEDISIDPAEIWVTVEADGSYDFSYDDPDAEEVPDITVWVKTPENWDAPCLWAWSAPDGTNAFAAWPGEALEEDASGWLKKQVPGWINSVIVNSSEGSIQTADLSVEPGKDVWVVVNSPEDAVISYEAPEKEGNEEAVSKGGSETVQEPAAESSEGASAADTEDTRPAEIQKSSGVPVIIAVIIIVAAAVTAGVIIIRKKKQ